MKKYVSSFIKALCGLVVIFNLYIVALIIVKTDEIIYFKENTIGYNYNLVIYNDIQTKKDIKVVQPTIVENENITVENEAVVEPVNTEYQVIDTFIGEMTAYGPDCYGCGGRTASGYDLRNGNISYQDKTFGAVRIVAADTRFPFGTIIRTSGLKIYDEPFIAIVLDRGGAIKNNKFDLAFDSEKNPLVAQIGYSRNIKYEVLRYGY